MLLSAAITAAALLQASAAGAAEPGPTVRWKARDDDATVAGTTALRAEVTSDSPVDGWSVTILTRAEEPVFGVICEKAFKRPRSTFDVDCRWDTTRYSDQRPSANGRYLVRLMTRQGSALRPTGGDRPAAVNNRPSPPEGVRVAHDEAGGRSTVTWTANREPDIVHYAVEQRAPGGEWTRIGQTADTRFEITAAEPTDHRYRVAAERRNADGATDGPGPWTGASRARPHSGEGSGREPAGGGEVKKHPGREKSSRSSTPTSRPESQRRPAADQVPHTVAADPGSHHAGGTTGPDPAAHPPPAQRAALAFSPNSAPAVAVGPPASPPHEAGTAARPTVPSPGKQPDTRKAIAGPSATKVPDTGFDQRLPYPSAAGADSGTAPEEQAGPVAPAVPDGPGRRTPVLLRIVGLSLMAGALGLSWLAIRPSRRTRRDVRPTVVPRAPAPRPVAAPTGLEPAWLIRLEDCVSRLERCLAQQPPGPRGGGKLNAA